MQPAREDKEGWKIEYFVDKTVQTRGEEIAKISML